jgi:hypothetical protein
MTKIAYTVRGEETRRRNGEMQFIALMAGESLNNAKFITATANHNLVRLVAKEALKNLKPPPDDPALKILADGRKMALERIILSADAKSLTDKMMRKLKNSKKKAAEEQ